jgi:hypothetical protein
MDQDLKDKEIAELKAQVKALQLLQNVKEELSEDFKNVGKTEGGRVNREGFKAAMLAKHADKLNEKSREAYE